MPYNSPVWQDLSWLGPPAHKREPLLAHVRDLWTLHGVMSTCSAAIYLNEFGLELRIELAGELMHSQLSRQGESVKADLVEQGWFETTR